MGVIFALRQKLLPTYSPRGDIGFDAATYLIPIVHSGFTYLRTMITNKGKKRNFIIENFRATIEQRASWLWLLCDEAEKKGLAWEDFAPAAITRYGEREGQELVKRAWDSKSLLGLRFLLFTLPARMIFDIKIKKLGSREFNMEFNYCPLVNAWQKEGCSDGQIARLCDIAMCGDHGIAKAYDAELVITERISRGDGVCKMHYVRKIK